MRTLVLAGPLMMAVMAAAASDDAFILDRSAPWWEALRQDAYYRQCKSSCTDKSRGTVTKVELCDDSKVCRGHRESFDEYASRKCGEWSEGGDVPDVPIKGKKQHSN
jgi:hypothetical protein